MTPAGGAAVAYFTLGGAGSGKSTLARRISALTSALYLDKDALAGPLVELALESLGENSSDRESNDVYLRRVMPLEYDALFAVAGQNLRLGHSVVIDAPFAAYVSDPDYLQTAVAAASWPDVHIRVIQVIASPEAIRRRLVERASVRDHVKLTDWDTYWRKFGSLQCAWTGVQYDRVSNEEDGDFSAIEALIPTPQGK
jgi:predicted kinase